MVAARGTPSSLLSSPWINRLEDIIPQGRLGKTLEDTLTKNMALVTVPRRLLGGRNQAKGVSLVRP